ncbi:MAG: diacylglycerol kinase family protein [Rhodothermales bacterium]
MNENAGSTDRVDAFLRMVGDRDGVTCRISEREGDAVEMAVEAAGEGFDVVVAGGGDGTVNEVVNGLLRCDDRPTLGVLPFGTGNDFARMLDIPMDDPGAALDLFAEGERRQMDAFRVRSPAVEAYGINAASGGFSGEIGEAMTPEMKAVWGPLAYLIGAASMLPDLRDYDTYITLDDQTARQVTALNIVVANGRTVGGGKRVASFANPEDGLLDVVVIRTGSAAELANVATRLVAGNLAESDLVDTFRASRVRVQSQPGMWFNVDGELVTNEPVEIEVLPGALQVVVGKGYRPVVEP